MAPCAGTSRRSRSKCSTFASGLWGLASSGAAFVVGTESGFRTISQRQVSLGDSIRFDQLHGLSLTDAPGGGPHSLLAAEQQEVAARRAAVGLKGTDDLVGVAISGGGIRSATLHRVSCKGSRPRACLGRSVSFPQFPVVGIWGPSSAPT